MQQNSIIATEFYSYSVTFSAIASGASPSLNINIQADSDFEVQKTTYFADIAAAIQTDSSRVIPLCTVLITDQSSGAQLSNIAVPVSALFGTGDLPFIMPTPKIFPARSSISVQVSNFSASTTYNLRLLLSGRKLYRK